MIKRRGQKKEIFGILLLFWLGLCGCAKEVKPPAAVYAELAAGDTIKVSWDAAEGADGYQILKKDSQSDDFRYVCNVEQNCYLDQELKYGETYSYKIKTLRNKQMSEGTESPPVVYMEIPSITEIVMLQSGSLHVEWEDTGAQEYCLYGMYDGEIWEQIAQTAYTAYVFRLPNTCQKLCVSALYQTESGMFETPRSEAEVLLSAGSITSVTQMDKYTAVVQYSAVGGAAQYQIYRSEAPEGDYRMVGSSYETVYYDSIDNGSTYFYKVQPVTEKEQGSLSEAVELGTNAKEVFAVPVFMYHEFVTQADLDAGVLFDEYAVRVDEFERDLVYLKENGYTTITCSELADFLKGRSVLPEKPVVLTIDDGKLGVYKNAYPLLQKYGMKAVLAVIGERIDAADANPEKRAKDTAPYCTWGEIAQMSASGAVEIVSHSYMRHRYRNDGHTGANIKAGESENAFFQIAFKDYERMNLKLKEVTGKETVTFSYPYSSRSEASDRVWMKCGYEILLGGDGDDVRRSRINYYVQDAGINSSSALTRRIVRMTGVPLEEYMKEAMAQDDW